MFEGVILIAVGCGGDVEDVMLIEVLDDGTEDSCWGIEGWGADGSEAGVEDGGPS